MQRHLVPFVIGIVTGSLVTISLIYLLFAPEPQLRFDFDKDGVMSFDEVKSSFPAILRLVDVNKDGRLTLEEVEKRFVDPGGRQLGEGFAASTWFKRFDKNKDKSISQEEANSIDVITRWFKIVDRNHDQKISIDEIEDIMAAEVLLVD